VGEWGVPAGEAEATADAAVAKALVIEPDLAEGYAERGWTSLYYHWDFPGTEQDFRHALALDPNSSDAHEGLADYFMVMGRFDESFAESQRARELHPYSPIVLSSYCMALNFARHYDEAASICSAALELDPNYNFALSMLQQIYYHQRNFNLANKMQERLGAADPGTLAMLNEIHGEPGVRGAFDHWLKEQKTPPDPYFLAVAYTDLGRKDQAFAYLQKAFEQRDGPHRLTWAPVDPMFDELRSDPRFDALVRRVGLPPHVSTLGFTPVTH
jgi:adenylate cyclase